MFKAHNSRTQQDSQEQADPAPLLLVSLAKLVLLAMQLNDNINPLSSNTECQCPPLKRHAYIAHIVHDCAINMR